MYMTIHQLRKELSEKQIAILNELRSGCYLVTNEGASLHSWLEDDKFKKVENFHIRVDTSNLLYKLGVIKPCEGNRKYLFYYTITELGLAVIH